MLRIGFIYPSSDYLFDPFKGDPHTHFQILTVLEERFGSQIELSLIDLRGIARTFAQYHIDECDVYLHSVYTLDYYEQVSLVQGLRARYPHAKHIAGGPHAVVFPEESLQTFDALVFGDGEEVIIDAIRDIQNGKLQKIYEQKTVLDINKYPFPKRKWLPKSAVSRPGLMVLKNKKGFEKLLSTTVVFSRGCPFECYFCAMPKVKKYAPGVRYRSPQFVESEIAYLKNEYGIKGISLLDEISVPPGAKQSRAFFEAIGRSDILWRGQTRVDTITPEIAKQLKDSGCLTMCFGIESIHQRSLDLINKKINVERSKESIRLIKENGMECRLYMIMGLPGEPDDIVEKTWSFIQETKPDMVYLSLLTSRPGTELFDNPEKFGITGLNTDWSKTMHMYARYENEEPFMTFEYKEDTPWGKGTPKAKIVKNYLELQQRLKDAGLAHL